MASLNVGSTQPIPSSQVAVVVTPVNHLGDVGSGQRIMHALQTAICHVALFAIPRHFASFDLGQKFKELRLSDDPQLKQLSDEEIYLNVMSLQALTKEHDEESLNSEERKKLKKIFPQLKFENELYQSIHQYGMLVLFPSIPQEQLPKQIRTCQVPMITFSDYGERLVPNFKLVKNTHYLGFSSSEIGVLIPQDLNEYYQKHRSDTPLKKLQHLAELDVELQQAILGKNYSQEAIQEFNRTSKLYMGYAHEEGSLVGFIESVCELALPKENYHVTICLSVATDRIKDINNKIKKTLFQQRFKSVVILENGKQISSLSFQDKAKGNRQLRLIFCPNLPHASFLNLHKAAERETVAAGTQSMLEVMTLRKHFHYEVEAHLIEFIESFIQLLAAKNKKLADLLLQSVGGDASGLDFRKYMRSEIGAVIISDSPKVYVTAFFKALKENPQWAQEWETFINEICIKKNCAAKVCEIVLKTLETKTIPETKKF